MKSQSAHDLSERLRISLPADDPRFDEMRAFLIGIKHQGRGSPMARMLGEYALLGFLLTTGRIALGRSDGDDLKIAQQATADLKAAQDHVASALSGMDFE